MTAWRALGVGLLFVAHICVAQEAAVSSPAAPVPAVRYVPVVLSQEVSYRVEADFSWTADVRLRFQAAGNWYQRAERRESFTLATDPVSETLEVFEAFTEDAQGTRTLLAADRLQHDKRNLGAWVTFRDVDAHEADFGRPDQGDVLGVHFRVRHAPSRMGSIEIFHQPFSWFPGYRIEELKLSFDVPMAMKLQWMAGSRLGRGEKTAAGRRFVSFQGQLVWPAELSNPEQVAQWPVVLLTSMVNMQSVGQGYRRIQPQPDAAERMQLHALALQIVGDAHDNQEKLRRLYAWMASNVDYFFVMLGESGWVAESPTHTLTRKLGDCKAQTELLIALLREVGVPAEQALIFAGPQVIKLPVPSMYQFNHVIVYIPGMQRFVDPTAAKISPNLDLPDILQGRSAFLTASEKWQTLPRDPARLQHSEERLRLVFRDANSVEVTADAVLAGRAAQAWRAYQPSLSAYSEPILQMRAALGLSKTLRLSGLHPDPASENSQTEELADGSLRIHTTLRASLMVASKQGSNATPAKHWEMSSTHYFMGSCFATKAAMPDSSKTYYRQAASCAQDLEIVLPEGWAFASPPEQVQENGADARFSMVSTVQARTLTMHREWFAEPTELVSPAGDWPALHRVLEAASKGMRRELYADKIDSSASR